MNKIISAVTVGIFFAVLVAASFVFAEEAPQKVIDLTETTLVGYGADPVIVEAVKRQNAGGMTLAQIKVKDAEWKSASGMEPYMKEIMENDCAARLLQISDKEEYYAEIFVMDNQGANVAMTEKTSDYWQGDEDKFQKSYNGGQGAVFIDEIEFDESTASYLVQVSVPVKDGDKVIGAITFGIDVDLVD